MRIRIGLVLCLLISTLAGVGCRKALTPNVDRNQAPETWITAAPQDTITLKDAQGRPLPPGPNPTLIPFKFHVYWAASDPDGDIAGFYYAIVETLAVDPLGSPNPPSLPGPKARDYHFTTRTDSTFIFTVSESAPDREHAFFIYAVDNDGKPDPTPARVIFNAQDKYPPLVVMELARASGLVFERQPDGTITQAARTYDITDTAKVGTLVSDFVPATARLDFRWRSEPVIAGNPAVQYGYKLDEIQFVPADSSVRSKTYNTGVAGDVVGPGLKVFTLRAIDQAGWRREIKRRFQFNLAPTTWFSGPDVNAFPYATEAPGYRYYDASVNWPIGPPLPELTGSLLSRDSVFVLPANRPERKTFFEIYRNKIYVRSEWDTVNMNSWVVVHNGGLDPDGPYDVRVNPSDPTYQALVAFYGQVPPVLMDAPANGSPIGFRANLTFNVAPTDRYVQFQQTGLYPIFDFNDPQRVTTIGMYWTANQAGLAYLLTRAEDSYGRAVGGLDEEVGILEVPGLVARVGRDMNGGSETDRIKRRKVLAFYVDRAPYFQFTNGAFRPRLPGPEVYASRNVAVNLLAADEDPYNVLLPVDSRRPGGPTTGTILRWTVTVRGVNSDGRDTSFVAPSSTLPSFTINIPSYFVGTAVTLDVQLCDCQDCENLAGSGRCITQLFPITVPPPTGAAGTTSLDIIIDESGPGSVNRRSVVR